MSDARCVVLIVLLALTAVVARPVQSKTAEPIAIDQLPYAFAGFQGADDHSLDEATAAELGADAYLTRTYSTANVPSIGLYVAYYGSQRPGVSIHSPLHCLPGTGWEALDVATVAVPAGAAQVRQLTMRKNFDQAVVIYWYQLEGRTVANEIKSKLYLLSDSLRRRQSDAALVRVVVPVSSDPAAAAAQGLSFVGELLPRLAPLL